VVAVASLVAFGSACSSDSGESDRDQWVDEDVGPTADAGAADDAGPAGGSNDRQAAVSLAEVFCEVAFTCPKAPGAANLPPIQGFSSVEECKMAARETPRAFGEGLTGGVIMSVLSDRTDPDPDQSGGCLGELKTGLCEPQQPTDELNNACSQFFGAQGEQGDACLTGIDCRGDLTCVYTNDSCGGTCKNRQPDECGDTTCGLDEFCKYESEPPTCKSLKDAGEQCSASDECVDGTDCIDGRCTAHGSQDEGEACGIYDRACKLGTACVDETCQTVELGGEGAGCATRARRCETRLSCEPGSRASGATCMATADIGESCDTSQGPGCATGAYCSQNEVCQKMRAIDADCAYDRQCLTGNCDAGTCVEADLCSVTE
jgi:hypothetical protein